MFSITPAGSEAATRDLPGGYAPDTVLTVTVFLETPPGTTAVALEEIPPTDWVVSNISVGGSFDVVTGKVKWGLYFSPNVPDSVSYDITPPLGESGDHCFTGVISFDSFNEDILGEACISDVCVPDCIGRDCGDDGCGGLCGFCELPSTCDEVNGVCECSPDCAGRACGPDGCGGVCGLCESPDVCDNITGLCGCIPDCTNVECGPDPLCGISCGGCSDPSVCVEGFCECVPDCTGRECGDDGCGGSCGDCIAPDACNDFTGLCECQPDCVNRECGPDGCGSVCGDCIAPALCDDVEGVCVLEGCAASRILSDPVNDYCGGETKTIHFALNVPVGTAVIGIEDSPPVGWMVSNISDDGIYDAVNAKVKWGPFFAPLPVMVMYDVTPTINKTGLRCFEGTISIDGFNQLICGDECILDAAQGDMNGDGLVNLTDWKLFKSCLTGPDVAADPDCLCRADLNGDGVIDLIDVAIFMTVYTG